MAIHGNSSQHSTSMSLPPQLLHTLDSFKERAKDAVWALTSCLCQQSATVKINGRTCQYPRPCQTITCLDFYIVKIVKVLGEGGFSFVYLVQDESSGVSTHCQFVVANLIKFALIASVCSKEDSLSNGFGWSEGSYERSGGLQAL